MMGKGGETREEMPTLEAFFAEHCLERHGEKVKDLLGELLLERGITKAELSEYALVSEGYLYEILSGRKRPSRNKLLCLCFGLALSLEESQTLLHRGGYEKLFLKRRRDFLISQGLEEGWSVLQVNDALFDEGLKPLC